MIKTLLLLVSILACLPALNFISAQGISFSYEPVPVNSGFKMEGYWVWGGSMVKVDSVYHLFASRWPKEAAFPDGYRNRSEIVRATSASPLGPFKFEEVVIGERDSSFWDSNMAHNPTIHKIGDEYVLFYIGSDFNTMLPGSHQLLRRVGYAHAKSVYGPWERAAMPVIDVESNNPALLVENDRVLLLYRDEKLQTFMATADSYHGPYVVKNSNVWPDMKIEDFYLFKSEEGYHIICEDNVGGISGHVRWGVHLFSDNGINNWLEYSPVIVYNHDIALENDSTIHCVRRERPQLLIECNRITYLLTSVFDGMNSWCQPVGLKHPVKLD
jgi:hypothetical protein